MQKKAYGSPEVSGHSDHRCSRWSRNTRSAYIDTTLLWEALCSLYIAAFDLIEDFLELDVVIDSIEERAILAVVSGLVRTSIKVTVSRCRLISMSAIV